METLLPIAEQLDRVAVELRLDHPVHNRLALVLIDNTIEIMVRQSLWVHVDIGGDFQGITAEHRKMSRRRSFADRIEVLAYVKELTRDEADFLIAAHKHRNQAYHEWRTGAHFVRPLCFQYYRFACSYLIRFEIGFYSWSSNFQFSEIAQKYHMAAKVENNSLGEIDRVKLAKALLDQLPEPPGISLQDSLANDLEEDRRQIAQCFRFLLENTSPKQPASFLLAKAQFECSRDEELKKQGLDQTIYGTPRRLQAVQLAKAKRDNFRPRYRAIPHGAWSQSIARIKTAPNPLGSGPIKGIPKGSII